MPVLRNRRRRSTRLAAWLSAFAVLFATFAPAMSQALARTVTEPSLTIVMCTPHGPRSIPVHPTGENGKQVEQASLSAFDHCPFCSSDAIAHALPAAEAVRLEIETAVAPIASPSVRSFAVHAGPVGRPRPPPSSAS